MGNEESTEIGERSKLSVKLVIGLATLLCAAITTSVAFAVSVQNKLAEGLRNQERTMNLITLMDSRTSASIIANTKDIADLQKWREIVDTFGTPAARSLDRRVTELEKRFTKP